VLTSGNCVRRHFNTESLSGVWTLTRMLQSTATVRSNVEGSELNHYVPGVVKVRQ